MTIQFSVDKSVKVHITLRVVYFLKCKNKWKGVHKTNIVVADSSEIILFDNNLFLFNRHSVAFNH